MKVSELKQLIREEIQNILQESNSNEFEIKEKIIKILADTGHNIKISDKTEDVYGDFYLYINDVPKYDREEVAKRYGYDSFEELKQLLRDFSIFLPSSN